jgi:ABC-2 type transport system permease protein
MSGTSAAIAVEIVKTTASRVVRSATIFLVAAVVVLAGSLTLAAERGNEQVLAQLGPLANADGWDRFLGVAAQVTAAGGVLGFGVVLSWMIGREFADGTVAGLFALPVSRSVVAMAKLASYALWATGVAVVLVLLLAVGGVALGLGQVDAEALDGLGRQLTLMVLSAGLAVPAAWAATLGRGLLPGIATTIGTIVVAQVFVVAGTGAWFPLAAPALWALHPDEVTSGQLALSTLVPLGFGWATLVAWRRLQLD